MRSSKDTRYFFRVIFPQTFVFFGSRLRRLSLFQDNGHGEFAFGAVNGSLNCEYYHRIIFFSWQGSDKMDEVHGDGSADLNDNGILEIKIRFHHGDEAQLKAHPW